MLYYARQPAGAIFENRLVTYNSLLEVAIFPLRDRFKFLLERWLQRGVRTRLLFIAGVIILISLLGGVAAWLFSDQFGGLGDAIWWAFLRLTDPGYLGDDAGAFLRTLSTVITVLGYVVFLGSLVAILTQWLNQTMHHLESGLTPIAVHDHVLILGWTNRTLAIVREIMLSEHRVRRFLRKRGARKLRIVILIDEVTPAHVVELRESLGDIWDESRIILRSGSSLRFEHLRRVAFRDAAVVILPGADFVLGGSAATDARVIKTLISLASTAHGDHASAPAVVAEIYDALMIPIAEKSYGGGAIDIVAGDAFISRLIAQNIRHRGLSFLYSELLSHIRGNEVYIRSFPDYSGAEFGSIQVLFQKAILLGIVRLKDGQFESHLNPIDRFIIEPEDRLVFIARSYDDCAATPPAAEMADEPLIEINSANRNEAVPLAIHRVLILGWSHKVVSLLREFGSYSTERFEVDVLSRVPAAERMPAINRIDIDKDRVKIRQIEGDYTFRRDIAAIQPESYTNIVFLASDWMDSMEESDARTILGYVLLRSILDEQERQTEVLIELLDPENARLFLRRAGEVIISPLVLSHILAHVALRRELSAVFNELFAAGGAEFYFRPATFYHLEGKTIGRRELQVAARARGEIALGIRLSAEFGRPSGGIRLNPGREDRWTLTKEDEIIVVTTT